MALEIKQSLKLSQQLVMTPQLQQAIKLLQMNRMELAEVINQELVENPILEEVQETMEGDGPTPEADLPEESSAGDPEMEQSRDEESFVRETPQTEQLMPTQESESWDEYIDDFSSSGQTVASMKESFSEDLPTFESVLTKTTTLEEHLAWQLSMIALTPEEQNLGELIVGNLDQDGYLQAPLDELAAQAGIQLEDAEEVLHLIQNLDPVGVASRSLQECLMIQAQFLKPRQPLVETLIQNHMGELERKNYASISKTINVPIDQIISATRLIMELEPKPGAAFQGSDTTQYITPDIYVTKVGQEFVILLNEDGLPKLRVSPYYKTILQSAETARKSDDTAASGKMTKDYVQDKLRSAIWLIRSIHNRQKTIYKVTEAIVRRQRDFFEKGVQQLRPMILKDVANDIGMHESTISRVTTNKFVHTPVGIFELKYFFNSSIHAADGGDSVASEAVKEKIRQILSKEDPRNPISDQKIVDLLVAENVNIARRTVAKYRDMLGILPSSKRKKVI